MKLDGELPAQGISVFDFVPCVPASEGAGLWDCVEGKFYPAFVTFRVVGRIRVGDLV